jgi:hypothetical protein
MEELLVKYSFGTCSQEELLQIEQLLDTHPDIREEYESMIKVDELLKLNFSKRINPDPNFQSRLSTMISNEMAAKPKPQLITDLYRPIDINALENKPFLEEYLGPILFALGSMVFILIYGIRSNVGQSEAMVIFSDYSSTLLLGSACLTALYLLDQLLSKKQSTRNFVFSF